MQKYHFCPSPFTAGFLPCYRNIILFSLRVLLECVVFSCCYGDPFLVVMKHRNSTSHLFLECYCGGLKKKNSNQNQANHQYCSLPVFSSHLNYISSCETIQFVLPT